MGFSLIGTGSAYPARKVTNDELARLVDTSDEWIHTRTGIKERYILTDETLADLAYNAAQSALLDAGIGADELDLILCATIRGDYFSPSLSCMVQQRLNANCACMDINAACSGFIYAMDVADGYFARKRVKKVLIVAADAMSKLVDWADRATCVLFGDGAAAAVLCEGDDLLSLRLTASGDTETLLIPNVEGNCPFATKESKPPYLHMNGQDVYKFAVYSLCDNLAAVIEEAGLSQEEIDYVLPHQANSRIIEAVKSRLNIGDERVLSNIERCGNTSAAGIPGLLDKGNRTHVFHKGDILALCAFGGGFVTGACVLRWGK